MAHMLCRWKCFANLRFPDFSFVFTLHFHKPHSILCIIKHFYKKIGGKRTEYMYITRTCCWCCLASYLTDTRPRRFVRVECCASTERCGAEQPKDYPTSDRAVVRVCVSNCLSLSLYACVQQREQNNKKHKIFRNRTVEKQNER